MTNTATLGQVSHYLPHYPSAVSSLILIIDWANRIQCPIVVSDWQLIVISRQFVQKEKDGADIPAVHSIKNYTLMVHNELMIIDVPIKVTIQFFPEQFLVQVQPINFLKWTSIIL